MHMDIEFASQMGYFGDRPYNYTVNTTLSNFNPDLNWQLSQKTFETLPFNDPSRYEEKPSMDTERTLPLLGVEESDQFNNHSKDSLKFSRRISKIMVKHLKSLDTSICGFLGVSAKVVNTVVTALSLDEIDSKILIQDQAFILRLIWSKFKDRLSYKKNNKICVVKSEYWENVFSLKTFTVHAKEAITELKESHTKQVLVRNEFILNCFCEILFSLSRLMVLALVLKDNTEEGGRFLRDIETIDQLLVLVMNPGLYECYNHRSGKFALECCGKCKVCRSKAIPSNFEALLNEARAKLSIFVSAIKTARPVDISLIQEQDIFYLLSLMIGY